MILRCQVFPLTSSVYPAFNQATQYLSNATSHMELPIVAWPRLLSLTFQRVLLPGSPPQPPEANPTGYQGTPAIHALVPRLPQPPEANPAAVDQSA